MKKELELAFTERFTERFAEIFTGQLTELQLSPEEKSGVEDLFSKYSPLRHDPWGASLDAILKTLPFVKFLYEKYFRVTAKGLEEIPEGPALFIANHGGQIPMDAMMTVYALIAKAPQPRLLRGMVERWVPTLPFVGSFFLKIGQVVGDQKNCLQLLENKESVLVFPEGVKGSGKLFSERYHLQGFGTGFYRLAIEAGVPIIPIVLVGTEETYPAIANAKRIAKFFGFPYLPITPSFPLLGPFGALPLPAKISIKVLAAHYPTLAKDASEEAVAREIEILRHQMQEALNQGLSKRDGKVFTGAAF